jgi:hypothetical protein
VVVVAVVLMAELLEVCVLLGIAKERTRITKWRERESQNTIGLFLFFPEYSFLLDISLCEITSN